jgi:octanoyl-[GcvH]:protein N-octanoyltransferase
VTILIDQTLPANHLPNHYFPFALTDVLSEYAGVHQQEFLHIWQLADTMILGMKDTRVPYFTEGLDTLTDAGLRPIIRNSGGLGVINDTGVVNISWIFPKSLAATTDEAYQRMVDLMRMAFPEQEIAAYEIPNSYCPGTFDLSIAGKKIAGTAQRRIKNGIAVMMYLSVNGNQQQRGEIVKAFYQKSLKEQFGTNGYPPVEPSSMTTLQDACQQAFSVQEAIQRIQEAMSKLTNQSLHPMLAAQWLKDNEQQSLLETRMASMEQRNQPIKEYSHDHSI